MEFFCSQFQKELKESALQIAKTKLNDGIIERDRRSEFSRAGWMSCADFGVQGMFIPKKYGGMEFGLIDIVAILEGLGYGCRDNGLIFSINAHLWSCQIPIYHFGTEKQKKDYLHKLCKGYLIGANAMTESSSGSNVYALTTTAAKENGFYVLNGAKTFVTNAPIADIFIVYARTGKSKGFSGISCFLVEKGTKGMKVGQRLEKMGLRTSPMSEVSFDNCRVPKANMIGREGAGSIIFNDSMDWERTFILANSIGAMEYLIDKCIGYANTRKIDVMPIGKYQSVANKIVEMRLQLETSRLLLYKAAWLKSNNKSSMAESAMAKLCLSRAYIQICRDAIQIFGGYGYMTEYELERELRDALASTIYSGTSEVQENIIAGLSGL